MKIGRWSMLPLAAAPAVFGAAPLAAEIVPGVITVSATVEEACHVGTSALVFGAVAGDRNPADARASLVLTCTPATSYVISMDEGRHAMDGARRMADASGTAHVAYDLYHDAARTRRWGGHRASAITPASGRVELAVYCRLMAGQLHAGAYADTVTVTVAF